MTLVRALDRGGSGELARLHGTASKDRGEAAAGYVRIVGIASGETRDVPLMTLQHPEGRKGDAR